MADDKRDIVKIALEDVPAFMTARKVHKGICPMCETNHWERLGMGSADPDTVIWPTLGQEGQTQLDQVVRAYTLICANCGFIWLVARNKIEQWLAEKDAVNDKPK